jgi:hypothetical protein
VNLHTATKVQNLYPDPSTRGRLDYPVLQQRARTDRKRARQTIRRAGGVA